MSEELNGVIIILKSVCNNVAENPTIENLTKLRKIIETAPKNIIQRLHECIVFPLFVQLQNNNNGNDLKRKLVDTVSDLFKIAKVNKSALFIQVCAAVTAQIFDKSSTSLLPLADEELKESTICCLTTLYNALSSDLLIKLYTKENVIYFSQCIYLCTQIAKLEKMRSLRLKAINCLMTISYVHDNADFTDVVFRKQVAETILFLLPGILITLRNVALDDDKQGHKITSLAIKALNRMIILHMQDYDSPTQIQMVYKFTLSKPTETLTNENLNVKETKDKGNIMNRIANEILSPEWYRKTAANLEIIIKSLMPLQSHYSEKVRYELGDLCKQILIQCPKHLENSLTYCIEILISLSEDDNTEVLKTSREILSNILKQQKNSSIFLDILAENFYNVISRLPRIINGTNVQEQLSTLNLLIGYLRLLGPKYLLRILQSLDHLKRLLQSLVLVSHLEVTNITIFEEYTLRDFESITETAITWKHFKYIDDKSLYSKLQTILQLLSESEAVEIIVDCLCDLFLTDYEQRNEIVFLLNEILSVKTNDCGNRKRLLTSVLEMYTDEENWYLSTDTQNLSLLQVHRNIIQMCLLVEGIGTMSCALGVQFQAFLLKTLYLVLERAGNAQPLLSAAGLSALVNISKSCNYQNVTDLIVQNSDYYSFHVIKRLKRLQFHVNVLNVLNVIMKYSDVSILPSIMNVIDEVLIHSADKFQEHNVNSFLRVFYSYVKNLKRWLNLETKHENHFINLLKEYRKHMDVLYNLYDVSFDDVDEDFKQKSIEEMYEEDMKKKAEEDLNENEPIERKPPETIQMTVSVLKRSLNFLPNKNRERKLLVLDILNEGIEILSEWENELLPIVHLIWSPLVDRFNENENPLEINRSFVLLTTLAKYSKDFIRTRTSKSVFPQICTTLKKLSTQSYLKDRGSVYRYTQEYKLQLIILNNLSQLIINLDMSQNDAEYATDAVSPYLSNKQPIPLQECAINFYKTLATYDFDSVWIQLNNVWNNSSIGKEEFTRNTECLLKVLHIIHW